MAAKTAEKDWREINIWITWRHRCYAAILFSTAYAVARQTILYQYLPEPYAPTTMTLLVRVVDALAAVLLISALALLISRWRGYG